MRTDSITYAQTASSQAEKPLRAGQIDLTVEGSICVRPRCPPLLTQLRPRLQIRYGTIWHNTFGIDIWMALDVILLDMIEVRRVLDALHIEVHVLDIPMQIRIVVSYHPNVANPPSTYVDRSGYQAIRTAKI